MTSALGTASPLAHVADTLPLLVQGLLPQGNLQGVGQSSQEQEVLVHIMPTLLSPPLTARMLPETDQLTCQTTSSKVCRTLKIIVVEARP